jgi:hypothetical protein
MTSTILRAHSIDDPIDRRAPKQPNVRLRSKPRDHGGRSGHHVLCFAAVSVKLTRPRVWSTLGS